MDVGRGDGGADVAVGGDAAAGVVFVIVVSNVTAPDFCCC